MKIWQVVSHAVLLLSLVVATARAGLPAAVTAFDKGHYANAVQQFQPLAESGDAVAAYYLGVMLEEGKGVRADPVAARSWYEKAAMADHAAAQFRLGRIHAQGLGTTKDSSKASHWYLRAAALGDLDAQYSLGTMFKQGKGVPVDLVQAFAWFSRAAEHGSGNARMQRDFLTDQLSPEQMEEARALLQTADNSREAQQLAAQRERDANVWQRNKPPRPLPVRHGKRPPSKRRRRSSARPAWRPSA